MSALLLQAAERVPTTIEQLTALVTALGPIFAAIATILTVIYGVRKVGERIDAQTLTSKANAAATQAAVLETTKEVQRNTGLTVMAADAIDANTALTGQIVPQVKAAAAQAVTEAVAKAISDSGPRPGVLPGDTRR